MGVLRIKDGVTWVDVPTSAPATGGGVTDGDKGDIVVSASGATWMLDSAVVTPAAKTLLDDTSIAAIKITLTLTSADVGLGNVNNTSDANKPVSTAQAAADATKLPLIGGTLTGDLSVNATAALGPALNVRSNGGYSAVKLRNGTDNPDIAFKSTDDSTQYGYIQVSANDTTVQNAAGNIRLAAGGTIRFSIAPTLVTTTVPIQLPGDPASALYAAPKQYVDTKAPLRYVPAYIAATAYTLALADEPKLLWFGASTAITLTVPPNSSVPFADGTKLDFFTGSTGKLTVAAGAGVTVYGTSLSLRTQFSAGSLIKLATDSWLLTGDLT